MKEKGLTFNAELYPTTLMLAKTSRMNLFRKEDDILPRRGTARPSVRSSVR